MSKGAQRYLKRWTTLKNERNARLHHWRELSDHVYPWRARFLLTDRNKPTRNDKIINATPSHAVATGTAGMMSGLTSKSRPWFRIGHKHVRSAAAKAWLNQVEGLLYEIFAGSNIYNCLHTLYADLMVFGTAALFVEQDDEDVIRGYNAPIGSYCLASSSRRQIDTFYEEVPLTVAHMIERFGRAAVSDRVRALYDRGELDLVIDVLHVIEPNRDFTEGAIGPKGKRFLSCWMELGAGEQEGFLRESGYDFFPVLCPRWDVIGEDVYGISPGMEALGDCRALQSLEKEKARLIEIAADPPMAGPSSAMAMYSSLPGSFTAIGEGGGKIEATVTTQPGALEGVIRAIVDHERRINASLYADLWLAAIDSDRRQITAEEIRERQTEKMMQLGPVLERLDRELLKLLIDLVFAAALAYGRIPPPPEELQGLALEVEYLSILAQAQKLLGTRALEQSVLFTKALAELAPEVLDTKNWDELIRQHDDMLGVPPQISHSPDRVAEIRAERARQQQEMRQQEQMMAAAQGAKTMSEVNLGSNNALAQMLADMGAAPPRASA